jgi:hypothetical protein
LWTEQSVRVRVDTQNFFFNSLYEQDLAWLTGEQLTLLEELDFEWNRVDPCPAADGGPIIVTVTDASGATRVGVNDAGIDGWILAWDGVARFSNTFACREGGNYIRPLPESVQTAPTAVPSDGCYHAFTNAGWFVVDVAMMGEVRFELAGDCGAGASLSLYEPTVDGVPIAADAGSGLLARSDADGACPQLVVEISEPGSFPVFVRPWTEQDLVGYGDQVYLRVTSP